MKIHGLTIDPSAGGSGLLLQRLGDGLNVVIDAHDRARDAMRFIREALFASPRDASRLPDETTGGPCGWLGGSSASGPVEVRRSPQSPRLFGILTAAAGRGPSDSTGWIGERRGIDREAYDLFYCLDAAAVPSISAERLCASLSGRFGWLADIPVAPRWAEPALWTAPRNPGESELARRISSAALERRGLASQRFERLREASADRKSLVRDIRAVLQEISDLERRLAECEARREALSRELAEVQGRPPAAADAANGPAVERLIHLYARLDEMEPQIRRWREALDQVQHWRVQQRDHAAHVQDQTAHSAGPLDRELVHRIGQLRSRLERASESSLTADAASSPAKRTALSQVGQPGPLEELEHECRSRWAAVRNRAAVESMRQLRNCYELLEAAASNAAHRRQIILDQIQKLDPAGAEVLAEPDPNFAQYAEREGYLEARRHLIGPIPGFTPAVPRAEDRQRWELLSRDLADVEAAIEAHRGRWEQRVLERNALIERHRRRLGERDGSELRIAELEAQLVGDLAEAERGARDRPELPGTLNRSAGWILPDAESTLRFLTDDAWRQMAIDCSCGTLHVRHRDGSWHALGLLDPTQRFQVVLSLSLAVARFGLKRGVHLPLLLAEPLPAHPVEARAIAAALAQIAAQGQQVLVFTDDAATIDLLQGHSAKVAELAPPHPEFTESDLPASLPARVARPAPASPSNPPGTDAGVAQLGPSHYRGLPPQESEQSLSNRRASSATGDRPQLGVWEEPLHRYPVERSWAPFSTPNDEFEPPVVTGLTRLAATGLFQESQVDALRALRLHVVDDLLEWDLSDRHAALEASDLSLRDMARWRACCWLMCNIRGLRADEASLLVDCGLARPVDLDALPADDVYRRITSRLRPDAPSAQRYDLARIGAWKHELSRRRPNWLARDLAPGSDDLEAAELAATPSPAARSAPVPSATTYCLSLHDPLTASPSIGPKTAQRLIGVGIRTVGELLQRTADEIARQLGDRRISAAQVTDWQAQARLASGVPNLRLRDAPLLVACGIRDAPSLAAADPQRLYETVRVVLDGKSGSRLVRGGSPPELADIENWIRWAAQTRTLQAA